MRRCCLIAFLCVVSTTMSAGPITTTNLITELMMHDESANGILMGILFGPDFSANLAFASNVNPLNLTFSYSSQPDATYQGQDLQLSSMGVFDPNAMTMAVTSSGMLGATQWTTSGVFTIAGDPSGYTFTGSESLSLVGLRPVPHTACLVAVLSKASYDPSGRSGAVGGWNDTCNGNLTGDTWRAFDFYEKLDCGTLIKTYVGGKPFKDFIVNDEGCSPPDGGSGDFHVSYSPAPEPGGLGLLVTGILGAVAVRRNLKWVHNAGPSQLDKMVRRGDTDG
jgi:hypothetical protein